VLSVQKTDLNKNNSSVYRQPAKQVEQRTPSEADEACKGVCVITVLITWFIMWQDYVLCKSDELM